MYCRNELLFPGSLAICLPGKAGVWEITTAGEKAERLWGVGWGWEKLQVSDSTVVPAPAEEAPFLLIQSQL